MEFIVSTLYLFLPAYVANMAPVVATRLNLFSFLDKPLDGSTKDTERPLLGINKTYRGFVAGLISSIFVAYVQLFLKNKHIFINTDFDITSKNFWIWGAILGFGALMGDLVKSFFKRRFGIPPGKRWIPWDQLDMVFGGLIFGSLMYSFSWQQVGVLIILSPFLILVVNLVSFYLKIKKDW